MKKLQFYLILFFCVLFSTSTWARRVKSPKSPELTHLQEVTEIHDEKASLTDKINLRVSIAKQRQRHEKYEEAIYYFSMAIELSKNAPRGNYFIKELVTESYEGRGRCKWKLGHFREAVEDISTAINGYIQLEQYPKALEIFKEYETIYLSSLHSEEPPEYIRELISFFENVLPILEKNAKNLNITETENFFGTKYYYLGVGYRKIRDFYNAGRAFQIGGEKFKNISPIKALLSYLAAGECFQKANEINFAYNAYFEFKEMFLALDGAGEISNLKSKFQEIKAYPLLVAMLNFLEENFPLREKRFIETLRLWLESIKEGITSRGGGVSP